MKIELTTDVVEVIDGIPMWKAKVTVNDGERVYECYHDTYYATKASAQKEADESLANILISLWGEVRYFGFNSLNPILDIQEIVREVNE